MSSLHKMVMLLVLVACMLMLSDASKVLLVSMDGFRWDYIHKTATPTFDAMAAAGTRAPYINNTFITKTFPCHYSIATGLYEESHGIIANHMYDPTTNESFGMASKESRWWNGGEPLWVTARKRGLKSAVYFWPGSEAKIRGLYANIYKPYNESIPFNTRIDVVVDWFVNQKVDFGMLYFHQPDGTGHTFGPKSQEVLQKVREMDATLAYLVNKFDQHGLWRDINVLVTSDHGMAEIDPIHRSVDLSQYLDMSAIEHMPDQGPVCAIFPVPGKRDEIIANLTGVQHIQVYKKEDIPDHWHYRNNPRIPPLFLVAEEGWMIYQTLAGHENDGKGTHGYDNALMSMKPIFYARGPNIRTNYTTTPFNSVDIYPLVCRLLGIQPSPNNGSHSNTDSFVFGTKTSMSSQLFASLNFTIGACLIAVILRVTSGI